MITITKCSFHMLENCRKAQTSSSMLNKQYGLAYFIYCFFFSLCCECVFTPNVNGIDKSENKKKYYGFQLQHEFLLDSIAIGTFE